VKIEKHGRPVVVVISIEEFERLSGLQPSPPPPEEYKQGE